MRVWTLRMRMCAVYVLRVDVCACVRVCAFVCWHPTFQLFDFFCSGCCCCCTYHVVCITPAVKFSSSLSCGSHGTTAVAHQVLPVVTATDGASSCACVCVLYFLWERTHIILLYFLWARTTFESHNVIVMETR